MFARIAALAAGLAVAACSVVGDRRGTEEPPFDVVDRAGAVEIRRYAPRIAAETDIEADAEAARNAGFRRLAGYIFGGNRGAEKIAMTAPVAQAPAEGARIAMTAPVAQQKGRKIAMTAPVATERTTTGEWMIRFFMPSEHTLESLPTPNDDRVELVPVAPETVAVLTFSGVASLDAIAARTDELLTTLRTAEVTTQGDPVTWFYDPPWTLPFRRRNEIAVAVST